MKVFVFADVCSLYSSAMRVFNDSKLNYTKILEEIRNFCGNDIRRVTAYGSQVDNEARKFITKLQAIGFEVKYRTNQQGKKIGSEVEITLDVLAIERRADIIVLCTNNPVFEPLVRFLKNKGVRVILVSCYYVPELHLVADDWFRLDEKFLENYDETTNQP